MPLCSRKVKPMYWCWLVGFLLLLLPAIGSGQTTIQGVISDQAGLPVAGATVVVRQEREGVIQAFALSDSKGIYALKVKEGADSVWIAVSHLSYAVKEKKVLVSSMQLDWELEAQSYKLPEMAVTQPTVYRRGDTLVFDVNRLKKGGDESLEKLLARIPGITIESSGKIRYQDLPISKFYIEGLDLLEGRYTLATRNLNIEAIRDIEILEQHQPIRALDSLVTPPNAAINLRLKSKVTFVGEAKGGGGLSPGLYLASGNVFGFQKEQQFNALGTLNNTGDQQRENFSGLYEEGVIGQRALVSPTVVYPPFMVAQSNTLDNREMTSGLHFLRKSGLYEQLKFQAYVSTDRLQYAGSNERIFRDETTEARFLELLQARKELLVWNGRFIYELNKPLFYLKTTLESESEKTGTFVDNEINDNPSLENLQQQNWLLNGRLETIVRKGNKAYRIWSRMNYQDENIQFLLQPLFVNIEPSILPRQLDQAFQATTWKRLHTDTYTSFIMRKRKVVGQIKSGIMTRRHTILNDLLEQAMDESRSSLGGLFVTNARQTTFAPYVDQDFSLQKTKGQFKLNVPLAIHQIGLTDAAVGENSQRGLLVFKPELEYVAKSSGFRSKVTWYKDYNQDQLFYSGYMLRMNRQFDQQSFAVNSRNGYQLGLGYMGQNTQSGLYYQGGIRFSSNRQDLISSTVFDSLGQVSVLTSGENIQRSISCNSGIDVGLGASLQLKMDANYRFSTSPGLINSSAVGIQAHRVFCNAVLTYTFGKNVLTFRPQADYFSNNLSDNPAWQTKIRLIFYHEFPKKVGNIHLDVRRFYTIIGSRTITNQLMNFRYEKNIPSLKLKVQLQLNNVTNDAYFTTFTQYGFNEELSNFRLRPRKFVVKLARKF